MPPAEEISTEYASAVLVRGCIAELRYPRICAARQCRRHNRCCDVADRTPRCMAALHPIDMVRLAEPVHLAASIVAGKIAPVMPDDAVMRDRPEEAMYMLFDCIGDLPWYEDELTAWYESCFGRPVPWDDPVEARQAA